MHVTATANEPAPLVAGHSPTRTLSVLLFPWIGMMSVFIAFLQVFIPLQVQAFAPDQKVSTLGLVMGIGSLCASLTNPIAGALSDHSGSRFGRRTPWLLGSAVASLGALVLLGNASSLWMLVAFFCLTQIATNVYQANLTAVMPDRIPTQRRGVASAVIGVALPLGGAVGSIIASHHTDRIATGYALVGSIMLAMTILFIVADREPAALKPVLAAKTSASGTRWLAYISAFRHRDYGWTFAARCMFVLGEMLLSSFLLYMLQDFIKLDAGHSPAGVIARLAPLGMLAMLVAAMLAGYLSDRFKRRKPFVALAAVLLALNCAVLFFWRDETGVLVFYIVNGLAFGAYMAASQSLSADVLPDPRHMARDLGVMSIANAAPQVLAPVLGAFVISHLGGYVGLLAVSALVLVFAVLSLLGIKNVR